MLPLLLACGGEPATPVEPPAPEPITDNRVVVVLSWDTVRADALGAYGTDAARTPVIDALASQGERWEFALAHAPTTLNSHTTLWSGLDPHEHGVPRNGYPVSQDIPWLPMDLQGAGWDTIGVTGATVLDGALGMGRGFRLYDTVPTDGSRFEDPADIVVSRALRAVDQRDPSKPLFLFVHFYDAHNPYTSAPVRIREAFLGARGRTRWGSNASLDALRNGLVAGTAQSEDVAAMRQAYLAEVSWVDEQTGALLDGLAARGLADDRLVVVTSDHGEMLDETRLGSPFGHGLDVDLPAIRVPLVLAGTGAFATEAMVHGGITGLRGVRGELLRRTGVTEAGGLATLDGPHLAEATKPGSKERTDVWNNLDFEQAATAGEHILTRSVVAGQEPVLYGLDPGQPKATDAEAQRALLGALEAWNAEAPAWRRGLMDPKQVEALRALGYLE